MPMLMQPCVASWNILALSRLPEWVCSPLLHGWSLDLQHGVHA